MLWPDVLLDPLLSLRKDLKGMEYKFLLYFFQAHFEPGG